MKRSQLLMILGSSLLLSLFIVPMWSIVLEAPQYPDGLGMNIWINKLEGREPNDLQNINLMNHYVGMDPLPTHMQEFEVFPPIILGMSILGIVFGFIGNRKLFLTWFILMAILGVVGMYDFYLWNYNYGHNLSPTAPIKVPGQAYQPPLFGSKMILNFRATSLPHIGGWLMFLGMSLTGLAYYVDSKSESKQ